MPEVSVIIPAYNSARYLQEAVDSVLAQTFDDFEVLVIDDGSTDDTEAVMRRYGAPVRYIRQRNGGVASARNRGIQEASGRYIAFLDADDTWYANKLGRQLAALEQHPDARFCYSAFTVVDSQMRELFVRRSDRRGSAVEDLLTRGNVVGSICTVLADRSLFAAAGGFDPALSQCADWDMWVRLAVHTEFLYIDEPLVTYRHHGDMMSRDPALLESDSVRVLDKAFAMSSVAGVQRVRRSAAFGRNYMVLAGTYFQQRRYSDFLRCAARALILDIKQFGYLAAFPARRLSRLRAGHSPEAT
jgi:glycosyltransferase involved in cell wall biosynthesis